MSKEPKHYLSAGWFREFQTNVYDHETARPMTAKQEILEAWVKDPETGKPRPALKTNCCDSPCIAQSCIGYLGGVDCNTWYCATCKAKGFVYEVDGTPRDRWPASHDDDRWRLDNPRRVKMECCEKPYWEQTTMAFAARVPNANRWRCRSCGASGRMYEVDGTPREEWPQVS